MFLLTGEILLKISPAVPSTRADKLAALLTEICPQYGIDTADIFHEFIANVLHESGSFTTYSESLNYSVEALKQKFGRHRITESQAEQFGRKPGRPANQKAIANILYGGSWGKKQLGNTESNDGWDLRGSGPIQITGRGNLIMFANYMRKRFGVFNTVQQWAELLRTDDRWGIHSACWIFAIAKKLIDEAENDQAILIRKRINGGMMGIVDTQEFYERAKLYVV
jgi:putative chitinase